MKISVYMLNITKTNKPFSLKSLLKEEIAADHDNLKVKYLDKRNITNYRTGLFFILESNQQPYWYNTVNSLLRTPIVVEDSFTYKAALVLQVNRRFMVLSFNNGISMIDSQYIDYDFGLKTVSKILKMHSVKSLETIYLDNDRLNIKKVSPKKMPKQHLNNHYIDLQILTDISGTFFLNSKNTSISGKYGILIDFRENFNDHLIKFLTDLSNLYYRQENPEDILEEDYSLLNNSPLKKTRKTVSAKLNKKLALYISEISKDMLKEKSEKSIKNKINDITMNLNQNYMNSDFSYFTLTGTDKKNNFKHYEFDTANYFESLCINLIKKDKHLDLEYIINKLRRNSIEYHYDNGEIDSFSIYKLIIFEAKITNGNQTDSFILYEGEWFNVNNNYYERLNSIIASYIGETPETNFPNFTDKHKDQSNKYSEGVYNSYTSEQNNLPLFDKNDYLFDNTILKKHDINTNSKMEPCDILNYTEGHLYLYHIKRHSGPSGISHLCAQAKICADMISNNSTKDAFLRDINEKLTEINHPEIESFDTSHTDIILGVITSKNKQFFTVLELSTIFNTMTYIKERGFNFKIKLIKDSTKS